MTAARLEYPGLLPAVFFGEPLDDGRPPQRSPRDWLVDVVAFLFAVGIGAFSLISYAKPLPDWQVALDAVLGAVCCLSLWWRRRWPVPIALLTAVLSTYSLTGGGASIVAMFTVSVHRRLPSTLLVAAVNLLSVVAVTYVRPDPDLPRVVTIVIGALMIAASVAWGLFARARRQVILTLRERAERAEGEQQLRVSQARQLERTRIAREMHDVLAHRISLVSLHAGALEFSSADASDDVRRSAAVIRQSAHEALQDLREILGVLRADALTTGPDGPSTGPVERPQPTLADLPALVEESRAAGMRLTVDDRVRRGETAPTSVARAAYRVVQEGLTNARKHAPHAAVQLRIEGGPGDGLDVEVRNRGSVRPAGGPPAPQIPGAGQGLVGLIERTVLVGGRLEHGRTPEGDFRLHAWLPWPAMNGQPGGEDRLAVGNES